jgi:hypothetical protein
MLCEERNYSVLDILLELKLYIHDIISRPIVSDFYF